MGKEAIIAKIIAQAEEMAANLVAEANQQAEGITFQAQQSTEENRAAASANAKRSAEETLQRSKAASQLELKKYELDVRQKLVTAAFDKAYADIVGLSDDKYRQFIAAIIKKFAEKGEKATVGKSDAKRLNKEFFASLNNGIVLDEHLGSFEYGVMLSTKDYDKDLTIKSFVEQAKDKLLKQVADTLFAGLN